MNFSFNSNKSSTIAAEPLRVLILGPFSAKAPELQSARINSDNFDQVLAMFDHRHEFTVPNYISAQGKDIHISLGTQCISDFHPLQIIENVPALKDLYELLQLCQQYQFRQIDDATFQNRIQSYSHFDSHQLHEMVKRPAPIPIPEEQSSDRIDRLFDLVDAPDAEATKPASAPNLLKGLDQLIGDLVGDGARQNISTFVKQCQDRLKLQLDSILHHKEFQQREALWRGLRLFIDHCDFRTNLYVDLVNCPANPNEDYIHQLKLRLDNDENQYSCIFYNREFNNSPFDLELLEQMGKFADDQQTPLVSNISPHFFACSDYTQLKDGQSLFAEGHYDKFQSIQDKDFSRWLCLCLNPFLARNEYKINKKNKLEYKENWVHGDYVWANPMWLLACKLVNSYKHYAWPSQITGHRNAVDHLPITTEHALTPHSPLLYHIPLNIAEDLANMGINSLVGIAQRDSVFLPFARSLHKAPHYNEQNANQMSQAMATLPYLLLLRQMINNIVKYKSQHIGESSNQAHWQEYLEQLLSTTGPGHDVMCRLEQHHGENILSLDLIAGDGVGHFPAFQFSFSV